MMRLFGRKEKAPEIDPLKTPDLKQFSAWIRAVVELYDLEEGKFTLAVGIGGFLIYIDNQGFLWVPYDYIRTKLNQFDKKDLAKPTLIGSGAAIASVLHFPLSSIFIANIALSRIYSWFAVSPPKRPISVLHSELGHLVVKPFPLKNWKILLEKTEETLNGQFEMPDGQKRLLEQYPFLQEIYDSSVSMTTKGMPAISIHIKTIFEVSAENVFNRTISFLKGLVIPSVKPQFVFPIHPTLIDFLGELAKRNIRFKISS